MVWFRTHDTQQKVFKNIGMVADQTGILKRYKREKKSWESHLNQTKEYILSSAMQKKKGKCAILGSGWLLDVPIVELSELFQEVWLFDMHHPKSIKEKYAALPNIHYVETDISGFAMEIFRISKAKTKKIDESFTAKLQPTFDFTLDDFDYVVSCNILNQLDILLLDFLKSKKMVSPESENQIRTQIQDLHILRLPIGRSCLVTDVEEFWLNRKQEIVRQIQLIYSKHIPVLREKTWIWHFDTHYTYQDDYLTSFQVKAFQI
jgi:hypothetical protein